MFRLLSEWYYIVAVRKITGLWWTGVFWTHCCLLMKNVQKSWQPGHSRGNQQQAAHCSEIHIGFYGSAGMTRSLPLLLLEPLSYFQLTVSHVIHPFIHSKPGVPRLYFTIPCRETCFSASWWAFQHGSVLEWWQLLFLASLLSSALSLMLEDDASTLMWSASVYIPNTCLRVFCYHDTELCF